MMIWSHEDRLYEITGGFSLPDDAWQYELVGLTGSPGTGPYLTVTIPDSVVDGPFTPKAAEHATVHAGGGVVPWPILAQFVDMLDASGDLVEEQRDPSPESALPLTLNVWGHGERQFTVNSFHLCGDGDWCYELFEMLPASDRNDYLEVRIPDASPDHGPFVPMHANHVTLTMHGRWNIPWPIFRRLLDAIRAAGDVGVVES
ncbi:hypothetical protein [Actinoplanes solisilvae]|uniref:hypothetical protein n=1 Tax=Actinoplanes solisilvae TaxID=2486853 RepID=UPI000FD99853|nr:hypothetical protein [Actinoplanes solisilvae]